MKPTLIVFAVCGLTLGMASLGAAAPAMDDQAMPGMDSKPKMDMPPGMGLRRDLRKPAGMQADPDMPPEEESPPATKDSPAAQVFFQDYYRVDEPITQARLEEIAPQMKPTRRRPTTRPAARAKSQEKMIRRPRLSPPKSAPTE